VRPSSKAETAEAVQEDEKHGSATILTNGFLKISRLLAEKDTKTIQVP
jgi:hypothetical protein